MRRVTVAVAAAALALGAPLVAQAQTVSQDATGPPAGTPVEEVTAVDGMRFTVASGRYTYDGNDQLLFGADATTAAVDAFYAALDVGSDVQVLAYSPDPAAVSRITLVSEPSAGQAPVGATPDTLAYTGPQLEPTVTGAALLAAGWALVVATRMRNAGRHVRA